MCIFRFNNKIKLETLDDIMSTSINKGVKLGTKITIPQNFIGLFYYSDKYLFSLPSGEYNFQLDTFNKVIKSNRKKFNKNEKPSYDFLIHYTNLSRQKIDLDFFVTSNFKQKIKYNLKAVYEISSPQEFASEMLITWYKTTSKRTLKILNSWFKNFAIENFRKKIKQDKNLNNQILENANKYFKNYGITICDIKLTKTQENLTIEENIPTTQNREEKVFINNNSQAKNSPNYPQPKKLFCPNCQSKVYQNSDYCHICGYRFIKTFSDKFKN